MHYFKTLSVFLKKYRPGKKAVTDGTKLDDKLPSIEETKKLTQIDRFKRPVFIM